MVLAKFYTDKERKNFSWYRAIVSSVENKSSSFQTTRKFGVNFIDYGNSEVDLSIDDLFKLPDSFSLKNFGPPFAYKTRLADIKSKFDEDYLFDYLENPLFKIKPIFKNQTKQTVTNRPTQLVTYDVEIWNIEQTRCLNKEVDNNYISNKLVILKIKKLLNYFILIF